MFRGQKGITLVALVITIIVLVILAAVSISLVLGENGIITRANNAQKVQTNATNAEQEMLQNAVNWLNANKY